MTITINQKKLFTAIKNAERVVAKNQQLPILQSLLLKADNGVLCVSATNLEIGVNYYVNAKVTESGSIAVPAKVFSDFISTVHDEKIDISTTGTVMNIHSERYKTQILCSQDDEFPIIPVNKEHTGFRVRQSLLKHALVSVIDSTALSDTRPELSGIYVHFNTDRAEFAATDSYRLSEKSFQLKNDIIWSSILPRATALELIRILDQGDNEVMVSFSNNQIFISSDEFQLVSRLIDGRYPEYKRIIPERFLSVVRVKKSELEKGIKTASIFSSSISDIKIKVSEGSIYISAKNSDKGEINATLACELKNDPFELNANYTYVLDGLKPIESEYVMIQYTGDGSPLVLKAENKNDFTYLIMPLRT